MLNHAMLFLGNAILGLLTLAFLLRFFFHITRVPFQSPVAQMITALTNFAVLPMRKLLAKFNFFGVRKIDLASLLLAFICQLLLKVLTLVLNDFPFMVAGSNVWLMLLAASVVSLIAISLSIFMYAVLIQAVLSWINPHTAIAPVLDQLTQPILSVVRRFVPMVSQIDLSPLVFIILVQLVLTTFLLPMESQLLHRF